MKRATRDPLLVQRYLWLILYQKNMHLRKHVGFKSWSVGASADVSLFKHKWDPFLIPVTVPDEKHNLTSTFLISSQILSLISTNTSIYQEHCLKKLAVDQRGNVNHCYCQSVDLFRIFFWILNVSKCISFSPALFQISCSCILSDFLCECCDWENWASFSSQAQLVPLIWTNEPRAADKLIFSHFFPVG